MSTAALTEAVFYILLSLDAPLHGYGIMQNVERLSGGPWARTRVAGRNTASPPRDAPPCARSLPDCRS